jgi:DNA-binding MarR family transcriptional regulator
MILSTDEAAVLNAFGEDRKAKVFELASIARLSPSEVQNVLTLLEGKGLVVFDGERSNVHLTKHGVRVITVFEDQARQVFSSTRSGGDVESRSGGALQSKGLKHIEVRGGDISDDPSDDLDSEQVDRDLDAEIRRLG